MKQFGDKSLAKVGGALLLLALGMALSYFTAPKDHFFLPNDQYLSAVGMALSKSHLDQLV
ncbi:MAG: hypothetical protein AAFQ98_12735 [Bacteroidota bacterium]